MLIKCFHLTQSYQVTLRITFKVKKKKQTVNVADYILKDCRVAILAGLKMFFSYSMAPFQAGISSHGIKRFGKYLNDLSTSG